MDPTLDVLLRMIETGFANTQRQLSTVAEGLRTQGIQLATTEQTLRDLPCRRQDGSLCPHAQDTPFPTKRQAAWYGGIAAAIYGVLYALGEIATVLRDVMRGAG